MASRRDAGFSLVGLLAVATITLILMAAAVPSWKYVAKDEREEELLFRGGQIAGAIERYQKDAKNANTLPPSLEVLVKGHYLRKNFKDPMTKSGKWRLIHPGEGGPIPGVPGGPRAGGPSAVPGSSPTASPASGFGAGFGLTTSSPSPGASGGLGSLGNESLGPLQGVASTSTEKSLRLVNGQDHYNNWKFIPGVPIVIGRQKAPGAPGQATPGGLPGLPGANPARGNPSPPGSFPR